MEQFIVRVLDGVDRPLLGEEYRKRDHADGKMKYYQLHEIVNEQRGIGVDLKKGMVEWTDITYNMKEVEAPAK
ncbi:MAG: hypothetical protein JWM44_3103 [Bacilli bacterium]|nr:hypothetical protein [Bacilli bacterium]